MINYADYVEAKRMCCEALFCTSPKENGARLRFLVVHPTGEIVAHKPIEARQPMDAHITFHPVFGYPGGGNETVKHVEVRIATIQGEHRRRVAINAASDVVDAALHAYRAITTGDYDGYQK